MAKPKSLSVLGGGEEGAQGETQIKQFLGRRIWRAYAGCYERSEVLIEQERWEECEALYNLMLTAFTRQALPEEMAAFKDVLLLYNGERSVYQRTPGVDENGKPLPRKQRLLTYNSRFFREWFWPKMREQTKATVGSLFDPYIVGSFVASALEPEVEKRDLEISANTPFTGESVSALKQDVLKMVGVVAALEEAAA